MTTKNLDAAQCQKGFTFGCDPELFILDGKGRPVVPTFIPGTKEEPFKVQKGAIQRDGMAAEFNIDPASSFKEFNDNITAVLNQLKGFIPKDHTFSFVPAIRFDPEVFDSAPEDAKELGCTPDYNAWTGEVNPPPGDPEDPYLRTAAGHIHIGWSKEDLPLSDVQHILNCQDVVKQLDWYLGAWSCLVDPDPVRRKLYGKAGAYRPKSYGVEYRVLSNFWITTPELRCETWNRLQAGIADMKRQFMPENCDNLDNVKLQESINTAIRSDHLERYYRYPILAFLREDPFDLRRARKASSTPLAQAWATMAPIAPAAFTTEVPTQLTGLAGGVNGNG